MASRFSGFVDKLQGLNWQLAITTTDVRTCKDCTPEDGKLLKFDGMSSDTWILNSSMPIAAAKTAFAETIQREEQGSGYEQGIRASYRAIERAFATGSSSTNARNRSFFRQNATLAILVVTDADETAHDGTKTSNTPDGLIDLVKTKWNGQKTFTFHSIIVKPDDSVCKGKDGNEGYGYSYDSLSTKTGGIVGTVCSPDYTSQLESIGQSTAELQKSLTLACAPIDTDGDGKADVTVTLQNGGAASAYVVSGLKVTFENALPAGTARVQYSCLK